MSGLSAHKREIVRRLVEASPDPVVHSLQKALAAALHDPALWEVHQLVEAEANGRRLRDAALRPMAAMFVGDGTAADRLTFPQSALAHIWRGLMREAPDEVNRLVAILDDVWSMDDPVPLQEHLDGLAAQGLRERTAPGFARAADLCDQARPNGAALLASCFDLASVARRASGKLADWISRTTDDAAAAARVAFKDATAISEDAGLRFFELLAAQLEQPWMILRIVSAVMGKPVENYLAGTEFAPFALRIMDAVDEALVRIQKLNADDGKSAGLAAAKMVELATAQITELEQCIDLSRDAPWGHRINKQKQLVVATVEKRFRAAEAAVWNALPTEPVKVLKLMKDVPRLNTEPDPRAVKRAVTLLAFASEVRISSIHGGFTATRSQLIDGLGAGLEHYLEDVLQRLRNGSVEDPAMAQHYLAVVAEFIGLLQGRKAAELVRRRAAAVAEPVRTARAG